MVGALAPAEVSSFVICHSSFAVHIPRPDVDLDQCFIDDLVHCRAAHGAGDFDAAAKERGLGRGVWRRHDGKHFRRANDQCAGEIHRLAGRIFFRSHVYLVDLVRKENERRQRVATRTDETAGCACFLGFAGFFNRAWFFCFSCGFGCA